MANFSVTLGTYAIGTETAIKSIKILTARKLEQFPIIRDDTTIIPKGRLSPLTLNFKGSVVGSDYTSLRTAIKELRNAVQGDKRNLTLDSERFINVISSSFNYSFITTDFANYDIKFVSELPYFLANNASSDIRGPESASTYIINNSGDIRIPLKIGITASTLGISDDIQIENVSSGSLCKFRGALSSTEYLSIDTGFDNYNKPDFTVDLQGVSAMSAYEGDFLWLETGDNQIRFTGAVASTISLYWREGFTS